MNKIYRKVLHKHIPFFKDVKEEDWNDWKWQVRNAIRDVDTLSKIIKLNDKEKIALFSDQMDAGRILVNTPSSMGAVGGIYNLLPPSFSLACGATGKTTTMDNVSIKHLINLQRISRRRMNQRLRDFDKKYYFDENIKVDEIEKLFNKNF